MAVTTLESVCILEKDTSGDVITTWAFPGVSAPLEEVITLRSQLSSSVIELDFTFSKYKDQWIYIFTNVPQDSPLSAVSAFSLCLVSKHFHPEKYGALAKLLWTVYAQTGTPVKVQEGFLSVLVRGAYGDYSDAAFNERQAWLASPISSLIETFREQVLLLWTGVMLKKRIVIYGPHLDQLLAFVRAVPLLALHRQSWDMLRPFVTMSATELEDLKSASYYVAGVTDSSVRNTTSLFDLFVDTSAGTCEVTAEAKGDFAMGTFHAQLAKALLGAVEVQQPQPAIIKIITAKTQELLDNLRGIVAEDGLAGIKTRKLPPVMERFCINLALAESLGS